MDRYELKINLTVNKKTENGVEAFFDSSLNYASLPYEGVVAIEKLFLEMAGKLSEWGVEIALSKGLEDKLTALGVVKK